LRWREKQHMGLKNAFFHALCALLQKRHGVRSKISKPANAIMHRLSFESLNQIWSVATTGA
jgi:hypothetical protein